MPKGVLKPAGEVSSVAENRREPRFSYQLIFCIEGIEMPSTNISLTGAQVCCPSMRYKTLQLNQHHSFEVSWQLPKLSAEVKCLASLRYANLCGDEYLLGLQFTDFDQQTAHNWQNFMDALCDKLL